MNCRLPILIVGLVLMARLASAAGNHTVQNGETLEVIARKYGVTADTIAKANKLPHPDQLSVGQVLFIPKPPKDPNAPKNYTVEEGDTLILLESMKTEIPVPAPRKGRVKSILVEDGEQVEEGQTLVVLEY